MLRMGDGDKSVRPLAERLAGEAGLAELRVIFHVDMTNNTPIIGFYGGEAQEDEHRETAAERVKPAGMT